MNCPSRNPSGPSTKPRKLRRNRKTNHVTYMCVCVCLYLYIYIYRERERERERTWGLRCLSRLRWLRRRSSWGANRRRWLSLPWFSGEIQAKRSVKSLWIQQGKGVERVSERGDSAELSGIFFSFVRSLWPLLISASSAGWFLCRLDMGWDIGLNLDPIPHTPHQQTIGPYNLE